MRASQSSQLVLVILALLASANAEARWRPFQRFFGGQPQQKTFFTPKAQHTNSAQPETSIVSAQATSSNRPTPTQAISYQAPASPDLDKLAQEIIDSPSQLQRYQRAWGPKFTKELLEAWVADWKKNNPNMTSTQLLLSLAVLESPGANSPFTKMDPHLCNETTGHANYMAQVGVQGHQGWGQRASRLGGNVYEIASESWGNPKNAFEAARDCVEGWQQSHGHKWHMDGKGANGHPGPAPTGFCYDMTAGISKDRRNTGGYGQTVWYCNGIVEYPRR